MKKWIIGAIVGGIVSFAWQTLSWTVFNLHNSANAYTPKQEAVMQFLNSQFTESGEYYMPGLPPDATSEQYSAFMKEIAGKPWAKVAYHTAYDANMGINILKGLLSCIVCAALLIWIITKMNAPAFSTIVLTSIFVGLIGFSTFALSGWIWYKSFDIAASLLDGVMMWGLCGIWLGWWLRK